MSMSQEQYYTNIKKLNVEHYAGETGYYGNAELRPAEKALLAKLKKGSRILDVGCGSGRFSVNAAKLGFQVVGIDITPEAIETSKKRAEDERLKNVTFQVLDITEDTPAGKFDYVFCPRFVINAISTDDRRRKAIENMYAVVKPGGKVLVESFNINWVGDGVLNPIKNHCKSIGRYTRIVNARLWSIPYKGLLPGDIVYPANKAKNASEGYAHLPSIFEIKSYLHGGKTYTIYELIGVKKKDWLKPLRYSIWTIDDNVKK